MYTCIPSTMLVTFIGQTIQEDQVSNSNIILYTCMYIIYYHKSVDIKLDKLQKFNVMIYYEISY